MRDAKATIQGRLARDGQARAVLDIAGRRMFLEGDEDTLRVLGDRRLLGLELELVGEFHGADRFRVGPFYTKSLRVLREGKKYLVTYWCDICSIRSYTPGKCVCCQQETELDLRPFEGEP